MIESHQSRDHQLAMVNILLFLLGKRVRSKAGWKFCISYGWDAGACSEVKMILFSHTVWMSFLQTPKQLKYIAIPLQVRHVLPSIVGLPSVPAADPPCSIAPLPRERAEPSHTHLWHFISSSVHTAENLFFRSSCFALSIISAYVLFCYLLAVCPQPLHWNSGVHSFLVSEELCSFLLSFCWHVTLEHRFGKHFVPSRIKILTSKMICF